ncbi:Mannosyl-oligosaccharide 1,2-alpha-mannosidase [Psilocybe cubensis]|uniref:Mannosyl-oligosaccharide 1,2-alpha-mannosidase n=1 Tax=Psilocybe cubensis TaxID=181762 RepID=A0ACB8HH43_PSICU|nr:Mannosyl-oligosaccharide 1,2-alpha-mannosidase [Psilocybe cubensis]KAH9487353.1 Mannosyl-oligosaccharide 1,2-alpha-mannosidase [Psilocybe cubensis]
MTESTSDTSNGHSVVQDELKGTASSAKENLGKKKLAQQDTQPATFGRSAIVSVVLALLVYLYQTGTLNAYFGAPSSSVDTYAHLDGVASFRNSSQSAPVIAADIPKRDEVVKAFKHAWSAYERDAMGQDEYHPLSKKGTNLVDDGGIGYMIVDAIDTMQIMGLQDEYQRARDWVANNLTFDRDGHFNTFETTIRVLGGLLTAYHLSDEDPIFLEKAKDLADRMMPAFETPSGLPYSMVNLKLRKGVDDPNYPYLVSTAEASTLQLELRYLSFLTDDDTYWDKAEGVMKVIKATKLPSGLAPIYLSAETGQFLFSEIRLGSRGDSFYEYLLKQYLQTNKSEPAYLEMYQQTMDAIHTTLVKRGLNKGHVFTTEVLPERQADGQVQWRLSPKQDHLVCFLGGSLMLGATTTAASGSSVSVPPRPEELTPTGQKDWQLGHDLIETCVDTYDTKTGLSPEIAHFWTEEDRYIYDKERDWYIKGNTFPGQPSYDARYLLRPETVESLFIAYRLTGNPKYREYGWKIFQSIEKYCRIEDGGYASLLNVDNVNSIKMDKMETFFVSETLKYLYLLFSDASVLPLNQYVFNTEAHPLPIFTPSTRTGYF